MVIRHSIKYKGTKVYVYKTLQMKICVKNVFLVTKKGLKMFSKYNTLTF